MKNNGKLEPNKVLSALKADMRAADTLRLEVENCVEQWEKEYNGEPYGNEKEGKSAFVSRDIKRQDEWQHASVKDPFLSNSNIISCNPVTAEDRQAAEQNELILNYQFTRLFNRYRFMTDVFKLFYKEGTVVVKTSWKYEDETVKVKHPEFGLDELGNIIQVGEIEVEEIKVIENRPDAEICRLQDIYIDPTCKGDLDNAQFIIHRYETDLSSLKKSGRKFKNLDKIYSSNSGTDDGDYEEEDETEFMFTDKARKKILAYEYWGNFDVDNDGIAEPIVCTWVDDVIIELKGNPLPDKKIPFVIAANNSIPFVMHGEANAELVGDNQKINTAIKRGIVDNMANSNNSQKGIPVGMLDVQNERRFLNGKNFNFNGSAANIYEGNYNPIPQSVFQVMELVNNETESMLGVKSFSGGISGNGLGTTAKAAGGVLDATSTRRLDIVRNIAENIIKPIMRKWIAYNSEYLNETEVIAITNDEFVDIKRDDLQGKIDIQIEVTTAEDDAHKAQQLSFLLQTLGQNLPSDMTMMLMSQIAKLNKMPDLAESISNYQPQPDPFTEQMKQLELQKLQAEILERQSRAEENAVDIRAKSAKAALDEARVRLIGSDTDLKDLEFLRKVTGEDFADKMAEKDHDRNSQIIQSKLNNNKNT